MEFCLKTGSSLPAMSQAWEVWLTASDALDLAAKAIVEARKAEFVATWGTVIKARAVSYEAERAWVVAAHTFCEAGRAWLKAVEANIGDVKPTTRHFEARGKRRIK